MRKQFYRRILPAATVAMTISAWLTASGCGNSAHSSTVLPQRSSGSAKFEVGLLRGAASSAKGSEAEVRNAFAVMETRPEPMTPHLRSRAQETIGGGTRLGLRFNRAQRVETPIGALWAVDGSKGIICLFMEDVTSSSCGLASAAIESGKVLEVYKRTPPHGRLHDFQAVGVVPNGVRAVRIRTGKRELTIRVANNAFGYRAENPIRVLDLVR